MENLYTYTIQVNITNADSDYRAGIYSLFNFLHTNNPSVFNYKTLPNNEKKPIIKNGEMENY